MINAAIERICIGRPTTVHHDGKAIETGIYKTPIDGRVRVTRLGIEGDGQADLSVHGGRDKAVYVYPYDHYAAWAEELGRSTLQPSQFGENLMVSGLDEAVVNIGDRFLFGSVTAVVAQPRLPCYKLGIRMGDDRFPARFLASGRLGFYLRIDDEGEITPGDSFERTGEATHGISVSALWRIVFGGARDSSAAARCLELLPHLDGGWQRRLRAIRDDRHSGRSCGAD